MRFLVQSLSGLDTPTFNVVVKSPRMSELRSLLLALTVVRGASDEAKRETTAALTHLLAVTALRDRIVHYGGVTSDAGVLIFNKAPITNADDNMWAMDNLWNAARDVPTIKNLLIWWLEPDLAKLWLKTRPPLGPWLYKPPTA